MLYKAYKLYKSRRASTHPKGREATLFRKTYAIADVIPIKFIGVFDTVGSLGNPLLVNTALSKLSFSIMGNQFHDTDLSSHVENAYQALAIDEKRANFAPTLWTQQQTSRNQCLEQRWFVGCHSNVGGGTISSSLSDIPLNWMATNASDCGLELSKISNRPDPCAPISESWNRFYLLRSRYYRPIGISRNANEQLDLSVQERYSSDVNYRPKNLLRYLCGQDRNG